MSIPQEQCLRFNMKQHKERMHSKAKKDSLKDEKGDDGTISLLRRLGNQKPTIIKSRNSLTDPDEAIEQRLSQLNATNTADDSLDIGSSDTPHISGSEMMPDWYEDLTDDHTSAFKELFDMLDSSKTGLLNADSLYEGLKRVDSEITKEEVDNVLKKLDKDGNGEIDFDEFLFHMTQGESDDDKKKGRNFSKRQRLFYTAITEFSLKTTLGDIDRSCLARMRQAPHVLSHYTAGLRLIGLTDRQLQRQYKKMQKTARNNDSPYAKPLPFVSQSGAVKPTSIRKQVGRKEISQYKLAEDLKHSPQQGKPTLMVTPAQMSTKVLAYTESDAKPRIVVDTIPSDHANHKEVQATIRESLKMWDKRSSIMSKLPGSHLIANLRTKIRTNLIKLDSTKEETEPVYDPKPEPTVYEQGEQSCSRRTPCKPKIDREKVPLPVLKIKNLKHRPTIDDLPNIREKATQAISDYYQNMRKATVKDAHTNWDNLYADTIRPKKLLENFRTVYRAYSPHKEKDAFVVCPWMPGPYRHFRTILTNRNEGSPDFRMERVYRTGLTPDSTNKRPFSVH